MRGLSEFVRVSSCGLAEAAEGAPEAFADFIRAEYEKWGPVIQAAGIKAE
jgi:tripartite-type tricarboxylate transporter receptor subunit TctC